MGYWGVKSYEDDDADFAIDKAFERVHGDAYLKLMEDADPTPLEVAQARLANAETLRAALEALTEEFGIGEGDETGWDEDRRVSYCGVVVRHAEWGIPLPASIRDRALAWLEGEDLEWDEGEARTRRRASEIETLRAAKLESDGAGTGES